MTLRLKGMPLPLEIATACFIRKDGKTLFIDYTNYPHRIHFGKYSPPGGRLEEGETIEDCVRREIPEEQGIMLGRVIYLGEVTFLNERRTINGKPMKKNVKVHFYECRDFDDTKMNAKEGVPVWVDDTKVLDLPLHEGDRFIWQNWLGKYKKFQGEIEHEGEKLTSARLISGIEIKS